ncbi:MAG: alpha/beta hydrolase [Burkholderiales bacterium]|nr:alpha/beta hydrolase [Burkholderiales bacterium]
MNIQRRAAIIGAASASLALQACATGAGNPAKPRHYVLVHGAWHGAWAWSKAAPLLRQAGHGVSAPTLSGLGERSHVSAGTSGLAVHVEDIVSHLMMEDLRDVVLVGHSYAGCVVSGVLGARTGRVAHAVYVDAFVPGQAQAMANFVPPPVKADFERLAAQNATVPPPPAASWGERWGLTDAALVAWAQPRMKPQAALSFVEPVRGDPLAEPIRRTYLKCTLNPNPGFKSIADGIKKDGRFRYAEVEGHHDVMLIDPPRFVSSLLSLG